MRQAPHSLYNWRRTVRILADAPFAPHHHFDPPTVRCAPRLLCDSPDICVTGERDRGCRLARSNPHCDVGEANRRRRYAEMNRSERAARRAASGPERVTERWRGPVRHPHFPWWTTSYPVLLPTFSTGPSVRSPPVGPSRFHSDLSASGSHCEFPFHHPVDPFLNEASEVSPSSPFLSLSFSHLVSPLPAAAPASRSLTSRRFRAGPALRRPLLYSLFEDNRSDLTPLFFLIPPFFFLIEPRRASSSASADRRRRTSPRPSASSRALFLFSSLFFAVPPDTVRFLRYPDVLRQSNPANIYLHIARDPANDPFVDI